MRTYFYLKDKKKIAPCDDSVINKLAKTKLDNIYENRQKLGIPARFINDWSNVSLYHPSGNIDKANSILLEPEEGAYSLANRLNLS